MLQRAADGSKAENGVDGIGDAALVGPVGAGVRRVDEQSVADGPEVTQLPSAAPVRGNGGSPDPPGRGSAPVCSLLSGGMVPASSPVGSSGDHEMTWAECPAAPPRRTARPLLSLLPPIGMAVVLVLVGWVVPAVLVASAAAVLAVVAWRRPRLHDRISTGIGRVAGRIAGGVGTVLLTAVFVTIVLPVAGVLRLLGRSALLGSRTVSWRRRPSEGVAMSTRTFALDPGRSEPARLTPMTLARAVPLVLGWAVVAVTLNYGTGYAWDALVDDDATTAASAVAAGEADPRAETPAFADLAWAEDYLAELAALRYDYLPFVHSRMQPFDGRFISGGDGVRASFQAVDESEVVPVVWFFGGSTMWGEGQRDGHTIPSEIARLADEAGTPVRVVNFGERGYVSRQELELFDRELGLRDPPDLAVFYDGTNDVNVQRPEFNEAEYLSGAPLTYAVGDTDDSLHGSTGSDETLYERYTRRSLLHELVDGVRDLLGDRHAGAATGDDDEVARRAAAVYRRTRTLIQSAGRAAGVDPVFFWQPDRSSLDAGSAMRLAADAVGPPTIDLSSAIPASEADAVYIDGGHTNERGARLVAEAMWAHLGPMVERLTPRG